MAIIQVLMLGITRSAGKILNTVFGWATGMLFGKVPEGKQIYLSVISFGSVLWLAVLIGIIWPSAGTIMLAAVPLPDWVDDNAVRLIMLGIAVVIPLVIGIISIVMLDAGERPEGFGSKMLAVVKGYPYTAGLAVTLLMMVVFAPFIKTRVALKRWESEHLPVIVESDDYLRVVDQMEQALSEDGHKVTRQPAGWMMRLPTKVLTYLAGGAIDRMVADELTVLSTADFEVELPPSDLIIRAKKQTLGRIQATIAVALAFSKAYMTWTKDANEVEDELEYVISLVDAGGPAELALAARRLDDIERKIHDLCVSYDEWQTLYREKLLVERAVLQAQSQIRPEQAIPAMIKDALSDARTSDWQRKGTPVVEAAARLMSRAGLKGPGLVVLAGWKAASVVGSIQKLLTQRAKTRP